MNKTFHPSPKVQAYFEIKRLLDNSRDAEGALTPWALHQLRHLDDAWKTARAGCTYEEMYHAWRRAVERIEKNEDANKAIEEMEAEWNAAATAATDNN